MLSPVKSPGKSSFLNAEVLLADYKIALLSRHASLLGRKEVLGGRAKFGIFGDGKELAQIALSKVFEHGDWRSGYYRDQTLMLALNLLSVKELFAQLYADPDRSREPCSAGRQMNCHFATAILDSNEDWLCQTDRFNSSSDISPTAGQMARLVGLGYASKLYRQSRVLKQWEGASRFSKQGREIAFGTIGNASTSEGLFWEAINAAGVLQIPMVLSIWDDGYGISVPNSYQTTKGSIYQILKGFAADSLKGGIELFTVKGHQYQDLVTTYEKAAELARNHHIPCIVHVDEMTQPQGHSTSGSHERYKSQERLDYERNLDCLLQMRSWLINAGFASQGMLDSLDEECQTAVKEAQRQAWEDFCQPILELKSALEQHLLPLLPLAQDLVGKKLVELKAIKNPLRRDIVALARRAAFDFRSLSKEALAPFHGYLEQLLQDGHERYSTSLHAEKKAIDLFSGNKAEFANPPEMLDGRQLIQRFFDLKITEEPRLFIIGEDVGKLGGVNLEFEGLNEKHSDMRVCDTGIREATILGQGIGAAMRGLRPIVDIQYLDYVLYCLQGMSDDLATLRYRSAGMQAAPVIVRTKGHRLEGIWHTGSPMGMLLNSVRGMHVLVPRDCLQACGMYQTLLQGNDPALVIEVLSGYRIKENCPINLASYSVELGIPEVLALGEDVTIVTYGACCRIALAAAALLRVQGISVEVIDVQTLLPFDKNQLILKSISKTQAVLFLDEDVPGGASAFMMQKVLEEQGAFYFLDAAPKTVTAKAHRAAYGSDGDYFSKPSQEDVVEGVYALMHERRPSEFAFMR